MDMGTILVYGVLSTAVIILALFFVVFLLAAMVRRPSDYKREIWRLGKEAEEQSNQTSAEFRQRFKEKLEQYRR